VNVYIRADASAHIGTGHIFRCLALAGELRRRGAAVTFLCRELAGGLIGWLRGGGWPVGALAPGGWRTDAEGTLRRIAADGRTADWLVVDHYGLDERYEQAVRAGVRRVLAIDDLADRPHRCDLLLDQNLHREAPARYEGLVRAGTRLLLGPRYALLRPEFAAARDRVRRGGTVRRALVSFGGADPCGATRLALEALAPLVREGLALDVVAGRLNPDADALEARCRELPGVRFRRHADRMAELMLAADVAVGAGGITTWERCCLGLPSLVLPIAGNQRALTAEAARAGAVLDLGPAEEAAAGRLREAVRRWMADPEAVRAMSERAMALTDGRGAEIVAKEMESGC